MNSRQIDKRERLARECAKLDPEEERAFAEEGMIDTAAPPPYDCDDYELLDFGDGRRLERFGEIVLDRPCPAAETFRPANPGVWAQADARFEGRDELRGKWIDRRELPERWIVARGSLRFELKRTEFGHLGLFPEQAENWDWIARLLSPLPLGEGKCEGGPAAVSSAESGDDCEPAGPHPLPLSQMERGDTLRVLNLFAYTGGSTLATAAAGAEVVHVDAAENVVAWARRNAELSGLADAPIRWIAEDALKFVKRELKRGHRYDAVILDPPSYGHGPHGEVWRLAKHLPRLLDLCAELTDGRPRFMLLTCHTPGYDPESLRRMMLEHIGRESTAVARPLMIEASDGRRLPSGIVVRCETASGLLPCH
jgi:23S rRNA (cytosine1962-C5)-methyltransferase